MIDSTLAAPVAVAQFPNLQPEVLDLANSLINQMRTMRRTIHANPELAYRETETAQLAASRLKSLGYKIRAGIAGSGVIAELGEGDAIVIRAEMDAVQMMELNQTPWRSGKNGLMHACGHDAHVAAVVGAAEIFAQLKPNAKIRIVLQPAEESADQHGHKGPHYMIENGALENAKAVLGFHVDATMACGKVGVIVRPVVDVRTSFVISHAISSANGSIDSVYKMLKTLMELSTSPDWCDAALRVTDLVARNGVATMGGSYVAAEGSAQGLQASLNKAAQAVLGELCSVETSSADQQLAHKSVIETCIAAAQSTLGESNVTRIQRRSWTTVFSEYAKLVPSAFFLIGSEIPGVRAIQHTPTFEINESCLPIAAAILVKSALALANRC